MSRVLLDGPHRARPNPAALIWTAGWALFLAVWIMVQNCSGCGR